MSRLVVIACLTLLGASPWVGCATASAPLTAQRSTLLSVTTAGVGFATRKESKPYWYHVGFDLAESAKLPARVRVSFKNPDDPGRPLVVSRKVTDRRNHVESPRFSTRPPGGTSRVTIDLFEDADGETPVDTVTQGFLTQIPSDAELRAAGLDHLAD